MSEPVGDITLETATEIGERAFQGRVNLTGVHAKNVTRVNQYAFFLSGIKTFVCESQIASGVNFNVFQRAESLEAVDFNNKSQPSNGYFDTCKNLTTLILRRTDAIMGLASANAFNNSPFASNGTGGTIYVPQALIASYQANTQWATILGYANNQIKAIEGSIYETQYADGAPIT